MAVNELQLGLVGAGAAVVAAVWAYNVWQERQHRKQAEKIFKGAQPDVLLQGHGDDEDRVEPAANAVDEHVAAERIEPVLAPMAPERRTVAAPPALPAEWADDIADCPLRIEFAEAVSAPALWGVQAAWSGEIVKPLNWFGYDEPPAKWRRLTAHDAGRYAHVAAVLQLADRTGAVSENELAIFFEGVRRLADQFAGQVAVPRVEDVVVHARALDSFCASVDVQLAVNVVETAGGSFMGTKLRGLAEAAGLALEDDGRFHARDELGAEIFALSNLGAELFEAESLRNLASQGISFVLDVPRVGDGMAVFDRMVAAARQMAQPLGGTVVDGQRHVLSDSSIASIRAKVGEIQRQMAANQIPPGSPRALRLFS